MKKILCILPAILIFISLAAAQELSGDQIPVKVKSAFEKKFTAATEVKYVQEKRNIRVSFKDADVQKTALFSSMGSWQETTGPLSETDLPKKVVKSISKNFEGFEKSNLCSLETPQFPISYRMDLKNDKQGWEVQFGPKGDVIRKLPLKMEKPKK
jgi:hypothetical protein